MAINTVNISEKFACFSEHWSPKIIGQLNGQHVKIAKFHGEFVRHVHEHEDEMFLVIKGQLLIKLDDRDIFLKEGEFTIIPKGVYHQPIAKEEAHVLLLEPTGTVNTGDQRGHEQSIDAVWI